MKKAVLGLAVVILATPLWAADTKPPEGKSFQVPYRLSDTQHIVVRAKINGKGPYNFILDTGAPALFVATAIGKKLGVDPDKEGWGAFDRVEIEGGVVLEKARARIEDPFQLKGMNAMGLAGTELHGVLGYMVLARYRITVDLTTDKMTWVPLQFDPPAPEPLDKKGGAADGLDAMGALVQMAAKILGQKVSKEVMPRGFLGIELAKPDDAAVIQSVLPKGPGATAGLQAGDRITRFQNVKVQNAADIHRLAAKLTTGDTVELTVLRGNQTRAITFKAGKGL